MKTLKITFAFCFVIGLIGCGKDINEGILANELLGEAETPEPCLQLSESDFETYDIPSVCMKILMEDNFDDDSGNWYEGTDDDTNYRIRNGVYNCSSETFIFYTRCSVCSNFNLSNFELEARIRVLEGDLTCSIVWGALDGFENSRDFGINSRGEYEIAGLEQGEPLPPVQDLTFSAAVNKNDWNKLTLRKVNNNHYFFINEQLVRSVSGLNTIGDEIFFKVGARSICEFDDLILRELNVN